VRDADTVYLFHFDDGHGSQVLKDDSRSGHEVELRLSSVISTAQAKFGASSFYMDGASQPGKVQTSKGHGDFGMGSDDFTMDCWVNLSSLTGTQTLFQFRDFGPRISVNSSGNVFVYLSSDGSSFNVANGTSFGTISATTWAHIQICRSGSNVYGFVNGVLGATIPVSTSSLWSSTNDCIHLGCAQDGSLRVTGYMDEFRVKRGVATHTANFTPPTSAYTTDDRTVLLLHFDGANGDKVTLDSSESSYGTSAFSDTVIPALSFANSAALSSAQTRGGHATSLALNGTNQYAGMQFATPSAGHPLYFAPGEYLCIEGWFYLTTTTGSHQLFQIKDTVGSPPDVIIGVSNGSNFQLYVKSGTAINTVTSTAKFTTGWNHFALVREGRGWVRYINGVSEAPLNPETSVVYAVNPHTLFIGSYGGASNFLSGAYDSFRITNGKPRYTANFTPGNLTHDDDTTLLWEFNGSVGQKWVKELSKNTAMIAATNARTVSDGVWAYAGSSSPPTISTAQSKFGGSSLKFTRVNSQHAVVPKGPWCQFAGDFTIDCWVYCPTVYVAQTIYSQYTDANNSFRFYIGSDNKLRAVGFVAGAYALDHASSGVLAAGNWVHVALVRSGATWTTYLNGVSQGSSTATVSMTGFTNNVWLGRWEGNAGDYQADFYMDEFRISDTARWTANFTPPTIPYGQSYVAGPYWVATKPGVSSLDLSAFSSIDNAALTASVPPGTALKFLASTDGYASALKRWTGSAWADTAYSMTWNGSTLSTAATAAQLDAVGNTAAELQTGLAALDASALSSLNVVALLSSSNASYTPSLDNLAVTTDAYSLLRPVTDYTVGRKKATGEQTLTVTRVKSGSAAHVFDVV
jgi:hypothetical protein